MTAQPLQPILNDPHIRAIIACAELQTDDLDVLRGLAQRTAKTIVSSVSDGDRTEYLQVLGKEREDTKHFHIEILSPKYITAKPEDLDPIEDVKTVLEYLRGQEVSVSITGRFEVPESEIEDSYLMQASRFDVEVASIRIKQKHTTFIVERNNKESVEIGLYRMDDIVRVQVNYEENETIDSEYLCRIYRRANETMKALTIGEATNVSL